MTCYIDSDWASDEDTRQSISANCMLLCGGAVTWMSKKQSVVALSSTKAEYTALTAAAQETIYNRHFMASVGFPQDTVTTIFGDNQSSLALAHNPVHHAHTRHLDVKQHFIRQVVLNVKLKYIPIAGNVADLFTKPLPKDRHGEHCRALGLVNLQQRLLREGAITQRRTN